MSSKKSKTSKLIKSTSPKKYPKLVVKFDVEMEDTFLKKNIIKYLKSHQLFESKSNQKEVNSYLVLKQKHPTLGTEGVEGYLLTYNHANLGSLPISWVNENHQIYRLSSVMCIGNINKGEYTFSMGVASSYY